MTTLRPRAQILNLVGPLGVVLLLRLLTLVFLFPSTRHGFAADHLSAAVGILEGRGPSSAWSEVRYVREHPSNLTLNLDDVYFPLLRSTVDMVLPLPSYVMAAVWKLCGTRSALAYLLFVILAEIAALIPLFALLGPRFGERAIWVLALLLGLNVGLGRVVVSVSYDPYAYLGSLLAFSAGVLLLESRSALRMFATVALSAITILGRELNLLLYPVIAAFATWRAYRTKSTDLFRRAVVFMIPFVFVVGLTALSRYATTGNPRPTRSVFWHTLWAGVGQFPNPYGLTISDDSVFDFARTIDPGLRLEDYSDYSPDSRYEAVLRVRAQTLFKEHPWLLIRNGVFRTAIILSPGFYADGDMIPKRFGGIAAALSLLGTSLMVLGAIKVRKIAPSFFWMILLTLLAQVASFCWFYTVGRVMLLSSHVYLIPLAVLFAGKQGSPSAPPASGA